MQHRKTLDIYVNNDHRERVGAINGLWNKALKFVQTELGEAENVRYHPCTFGDNTFSLTITWEMEDDGQAEGDKSANEAPPTAEPLPVFEVVLENMTVTAGSSLKQRLKEQGARIRRSGFGIKSKVYRIVYEAEEQLHDAA